MGLTHAGKRQNSKKYYALQDLIEMGVSRFELRKKQKVAQRQNPSWSAQITIRWRTSTPTPRLEMMRVRRRRESSAEFPGLN